MKKKDKEVIEDCQRYITTEKFEKLIRRIKALQKTSAGERQ
jgi:hypothetical protein